MSAWCRPAHLGFLPDLRQHDEETGQPPFDLEGEAAEILADDAEREELRSGRRNDSSLAAAEASLAAFPPGIVRLGFVLAQLQHHEAVGIDQ